MCVISATAAGVSAATALAANIAIASAAVATAASVGMGIYQGQQASAQAQASMNLQAQQAVRQQQLARQQMVLQQQQQQESLMLQQYQHTQSIELQRRSQQDQYNLSVVQANTEIANQYQQQKARVREERLNIAKQYEQQLQARQQDKESAEQQNQFNNEAANRIYVQEQTKLEEARKKRAFAQQSQLAKMIGAKGNILAAGRTGQSVGLLLNDVERQSGFAVAQSDATFDSQRQQAAIGMESAFIQARSANQRAYDSIGIAPIEPYMPPMPDAPNFVDPYGEQVFNT